MKQKNVKEKGKNVRHCWAVMEGELKVEARELSSGWRMAARQGTEGMQDWSHGGQKCKAVLNVQQHKLQMGASV